MNDLSTRLEGLSRKERVALMELLRRKKEGAVGTAEAPAAPETAPAEAADPGAVSRGVWENGGTAPTTFAQERLWLLDQLNPGTAAYNIPGAIRMRGDLDVPALTRVLSEIVRRHASLRTVFESQAGQPVQRVEPARPWPFPRIDLSALPAERRDAEVRRHSAAEAQRPFDLKAGPLFRVSLLILGPREHVALYAMHHIVSDGWSMGLFDGEVAVLYEAFAAARPSPLDELPLQVPDLAIRQRGPRGRERLARDLEWWKSRLAGLQPLELPTDRPRPPVRSGRGATRRALLGAELAAELTAWARGERVTLYMVLLAAFQTLLHRITGQDDVAVGSPVANRPETVMEKLIGFFVNTVVMRTDSAGDPSFREMLVRVRGTALEAFLRQNVPFERVVEAVQPERQLARTPLFQVLFALQNAGIGAVELPGLILEPLPSPTETSKFDLSLAVTENPYGLSLRLEFDRDLYEIPTVDRLLRHLGNLLEGALAVPDARLSELPLLDPSEREQLLFEWNQTEAEFPREMPVHRLFEETADRQPEALAVSADGMADLTYAELDAAANRLAHRLRRLGTGPEVPVLVVVERSPGLIVAVLAVLKSGSFFVPFDPAHPRERLATIAGRVGARLAVTQERSVEILPEGVEAVCVDRDREAIAGESSVRPESGATSGNLMYAIFTSGSTGEPKGVAVTHRNAARLLHGNAFAEIGPGEAYVVLTAVTFDPSILEVWGTLVHGGRLAVLPPQLPSLDELGDFLERHAVTQMHLTTALFHQMAERRPERLARLRRLAVGGEALSPALTLRALDAVPGLLVTNCYGPTEVTVISSVQDVSPDEARRPTVAIGRPVANTAVYVLGRRMEPLPIGVWGELYIGGEGVSRGYFGRPDLTAERFVPDPLGGGVAARLYRSGDMVRWRPDGVLDFAGRIDRQVKIRGYRIEPGEIEAALTTHPAVSEAAILVRGEGGQRWLAAYVAAESAAESLVDELRRWLAERLPDPMVPADFVVLPQLPLTPNGKVDRRELERLAPERSGGDGFVAPRTPAEQTLAGLWVEVLGQERTGGRVGVHDHFFGLGGHSLLATRLIAAIRDVFEVDLPLRVLFEWPTLEEIARAVEQEREARGLPVWQGEAPGVEADGEAAGRDWETGGTAPASFSQERLWLLDQLSPGTPTYNIPGAFRLRGDLDVPSLVRAISEIVRRQAGLRTVFGAEAGQPVQRILPFRPVPVPLIDLSALPDALRDEEVSRRAAIEARRPFDLAAGPLFRAALLTLGPHEHVALYTMHHIVSDGWSMTVFYREVGALYEAFAAGRPSPLRELPLQYPDYSIRQRGRSGEERLASSLNWWKQHLAGLEPLELPTDRPRPAVRSGRGASAVLAYRPELSWELTAVARAERATLYMVLLAAFQSLLHRFTGQDDVVVGSPVANRAEVDEEEIIGFFVNTLVMRTDSSGDPTFRQMLGRVRETALEALLRQDVPFEKVVEAVQPERQLARTPLFQAMFSLQSAPEGTVDLSGITLEWVSAPTLTAKFDLSLAFLERDTGLGARLELDLDLFEPATGDRMLRQLGLLIEGALARPDVRLSELPLLDAAEREQTLIAWNRTEVAFPRHAPIHRLVEERVDRQPDAVAVSADGSTHLTYADLEAAANRLAHRLRRLGAGPEVPVLVVVERSPALIVTVLAVLKSGSFFVPFDPAHPRERLAVIAARVGARLAVTQERSLGLLPEGVEAVCMDRDGQAIAAEPSKRPDFGAASENLMYVIFTSGSTGEPKGVAVTHRNAARLLHGNAFAEIGPGETYVVLTAVTFDPSILEVWGTLVHGGRLATLPPEFPSLDELADFLDRYGVTQMHLTTALFHQMAERRPERLAGLRRLAVGGEAIAPALAGRAFEAVPHLRMTNCYGPTEVTVISTTRDVTLEDTRRPSMPIGQPVANTAVYVLDRWLEPLPVGVWGELFIGGEGVSRGYFGRPDLTAERFVPDHLGSGAGARLYRSGDRVRWRPDGVLDFAGRIDRQVKIRGFRIEPGEIEAAIAVHPEVNDAAVLVRGEGSQRWLAAYVAAGGAADALADELRRWLAGRLPDPMIPTDWVVLPELPLTPNGKVDRRALAQIAPGRSTDSFVAPRTLEEQTLAGLFIEVLGTERTGGRVGVHDNFFELGGHSLMATRLMAAIRDAFQVELPLRVVFERPTLEGLAQAIAESEPAAGSLDGAVTRVPREPGINRFPVSFSQLREWILDRLEPGNPAYNIPSNLRIGGPLSIPVLTEALNGLVRRHEVFRTALVAGDEEPLQAVLPEVRLQVPVLDLAGLPGEAREEELWRQVRLQARTGFDLSAAPLLRTRVVRLGAEDHALLLTVHHIISDGWSMGILNRELAVLYEACAAGAPSPLPPLPVQYADYAVWLRRRLAGGGLEQQLGYWKERMTGAPPLLELPTDRPRPPVRSSRGGKVFVHLPRELSAKLEELALRQGATLFMVLLAAFQAVLARWSGQDDVVVGTYSGNRPRRELEGLIGFFINTLVLRTDLSGDPSFADLVGRVRETTLGAFANRDVPFEKLLETLHLPRDPSCTPLFQALLVLQNFPPAEADLSTGVRLSAMAVGSEKSDYDLALWLGEGADGITGSLEFSSDLFDRDTIVRLGDQLQTLLEAAVADPGRNVWSLPLVTEEERERQLEAWSRGPEVPAGETLLHRLVEEQAARTPDAIALEAGTVRLTYAELVERAGKMANRLREDGAGPGRIVALSAERAADLIVSMLAVLQAGAAYLPIDPAYPQERRDFMLEDSGAMLFEPPEGAPARSPGREPRDPESPAYVIYTSGSTGRPKGVVVPHRAISSFVRGAREGYGIGPGDRVLQFASISFDTSAEEIWPALTSGATLVLRPEDMAASIPHFVREVERLGVTVLDLPTAFWHEMAVGMDTDGLDLPRGLRLVILGGEEALADRLALWNRRAAPSVRLVNTYGPTETTIVATRRDLSTLPAGGIVPIGRPIAGARTYLLDRFFAPVPPGVRAELWIGGAGVAHGYLGRPDLTAERFVPDPFGGEPGARLYRTGDLAVLRPDGDLVFAGRADRQLKVRGYRIEPGEIEAALRLHSDLRDAVVDARGPGDGKRLVAWIVPREGAEAPAAADLRAFLRGRLPEPLLPAAFVPVAALPLTPSGKVDRRALPEPDGARPDDASYAEPQSALERMIAGIYRDLLRLSRVGLHDNFFDLGGHSLLIVRAHQKLKEALGREIPVLDLFRFPTVATLARHLGGEETSNIQKVQSLAEQQRAAQQRQRQAMERLRRPGGPVRR